MSNCTCSSSGRDWDEHSDYCVVWLEGRVGQLQDKLSRLMRPSETAIGAALDSVGMGNTQRARDAFRRMYETLVECVEE